MEALQAVLGPLPLYRRHSVTLAVEVGASYSWHCRNLRLGTVLPVRSQETLPARRGSPHCRNGAASPASSIEPALTAKRRMTRSQGGSHPGSNSTAATKSPGGMRQTRWYLLSVRAHGGDPAVHIPGIHARAGGKLDVIVAHSSTADASSGAVHPWSTVRHLRRWPAAEKGRMGPLHRGRRSSQRAK